MCFCVGLSLKMSQDIGFSLGRGLHICVVEALVFFTGFLVDLAKEGDVHLVPWIFNHIVRSHTLTLPHKLVFVNRGHAASEVFIL